MRLEANRSSPAAASSGDALLPTETSHVTP
jgi:hypothetical protein